MAETKRRTKKKATSTPQKPRKSSVTAKRKASSGNTPQKKKKGARANIERLRKLMQLAKTKREGGDFFGFAPGPNYVRFMSNPNDEEMFAVYVQKHFIPKADGSGKAHFVSPKTIDPNEYCPATEAFIALKKAGDEESKAMADEIKPSRRCFANVLIKDKKDRKEWVQGVLDMTAATFEKIGQQLLMNLDIDEAEELEDEYAQDGLLGDQRKGQIVVVKKSGSGLETKYDVTIQPKTLPLTDEQWEARVDLTPLCEPSDPDEIEQAICDWLGLEDISELTGTTSKRGVTRGDDEEEEELDDDEIEEDDEGETVIDEDEDEEQDDDEEDEDETEDAEPPDCFGDYNAKKVKSRGCKECDFRADCKELVVE